VSVSFFHDLSITYFSRSCVSAYGSIIRDQEILQQVTEIIRQLKNEERKPKRITLKRIQEFLGKQCLMPKHLKKMPLTKEFLEQVVEDSETFRKRRILWAIQELKREGEPLILNRVKIKAGVSRVEKFLFDNH
uniref:TnsD family Tn7-like transposition protein n=1 Tax=Cohnella thermotolerans TaxID=329858 RepID=UPI00055682F6